MKEWTEEELLKLAKKKMNMDKLKDPNVVLHPEISKWRSPEKPDLQLLRSLNRGQIQAIVFSKEGKKLQLLAGSRRYFHLKLLGRSLDDIKKDIREKVSKKEALIIALSENFYRKDMTPMEEARAINSMVKMKMSVKTIAETFGKSEGWVRTRKTLFELPEKVRNSFDTKDLDFGYSIPLRKLKGLEEAQLALIEEIVKAREPYHYGGIDSIEDAENFVTRILKQIKDHDALLAKYGPCPGCSSKHIREGHGEECLVCRECNHSWHGVTKEPWEYFELKQKAQEMGFEIEEGPEKLKLTPKEVAEMIKNKAAEEEEASAEEGETLDANFRSKATLLMLLEPMINGDNIQKLEIRGERIEIQLIEGHEPGLYFNGLRKDYVDGVNKARIETKTGWGDKDVVKNTHDYINEISKSLD